MNLQVFLQGFLQGFFLKDKKKPVRNILETTTPTGSQADERPGVVSLGIL